MEAVAIVGIVVMGIATTSIFIASMIVLGGRAQRGSPEFKATMEISPEGLKSEVDVSVNNHADEQGA